MLQDHFLSVNASGGKDTCESFFSPVKQFTHRLSLNNPSETLDCSIRYLAVLEDIFSPRSLKLICAFYDTKTYQSVLTVKLTK